ncbi:STAS domain-containing protein [Hydrogenimonas urashimensis]|uniref:STAS domain-containing protein n=1 Tax=Hydrogenimonas urashimensis TaxID=2740515 RepID=UPI001914EFAF|nr:STAS domain-containing protein [Hydrogenimonas urashimensis]
MPDITKEEKLRIAFKGRLDATNAANVMNEVTEGVENLDRDILLDLHDLEYISSAGLQVLLKCAKTAQVSGKKVYVAGANPNVKEILKISGFLTFMQEI